MNKILTKTKHQLKDSRYPIFPPPSPPPPPTSLFLMRHRSGRLSDQNEKQVILDVKESHVESIPIVCTG